MTTIVNPIRERKSPTTIALAALATILLILPGSVVAQQGVDHREAAPEMRPWSVQVITGTYMGVIGGGVTPFLGSLGSNSRFINPTFGVDLEYMLSPTIGLKASFSHSAIRSKEGAASYTNDYQQYSLGANFYVLKLFDGSYPFERVNPYVTMRTGYSRSNLSDLRDQGDRSNYHGHYGLGAGSRFRINDRVDATAAYHYTFFNPVIRVDGQRRSGIYETQRLASFTLGISVKLGSTNRPHARWFRRTRGHVPNIIYI